MSRPRTEKSLKVEEWRAKYPGRNYPNAKLARMIYKANNKLFKNEEEVRKHLRFQSGNDGIMSKHHATTDIRVANPYSLPKSNEAEYLPYYLRGKKIGILQDIHAPYHSINSLTVAITHLKKEKVDTVLVNGDLFDFHGLSTFIKDPGKKSFAAELSTGCELLNKIKSILKCKIIFKLGNHDERYKHFLWQKASELDDVPELEFETILKQRVPELVIISDKRIIKANALNIVHGHEFKQSIMSPVNIARGLYLRAKANALCGHHHSTSEHNERTMEDKMITTWSVGCLCELNPYYMPINSWNHGFAVVELASNRKDFEVRNERIWKGRVL